MSSAASWADRRLFPPEALALRRERALQEILAVRLPPRRPRSNPRVVKRKMSNWPLKRPAPGQTPRTARTDYRD